MLLFSIKAFSLIEHNHYASLESLMMYKIEFYFGVRPENNDVRVNLLNLYASVVALEHLPEASMSSAYSPLLKLRLLKPDLDSNRSVLARLSAPPARNGATAAQSLAADGRQSSV